MKEHLYTYENPCAERDIKRIADLLHQGGVIAYPTDLNWAFACSSSEVKAIDRIRALKPGKEQPFSLLCADISMVARYANVDNFAYPILKRTLPGAYTVLLERHRSLPRQLKDKRKLVGIRIPQRPLAIEIVRAMDKPLVTTSVPLSNSGAPFHFGYEVADTYGHAIDLLCDLGSELSGQETTIFSLANGEIELIREGAGSMDGL